MISLRSRIHKKNEGKERRLTQEELLLDNKSLRSPAGESTGWNELVKDRVALAIATSGRLLIGINDWESFPTFGLRASTNLPGILRCKAAGRTVNVTALPKVIRHRRVTTKTKVELMRTPVEAFPVPRSADQYALANIPRVDRGFDE